MDRKKKLFKWKWKQKQNMFVFFFFAAKIALTVWNILNLGNLDTSLCEFGTEGKKKSFLHINVLHYVKKEKKKIFFMFLHEKVSRWTSIWCRVHLWIFKSKCFIYSDFTLKLCWWIRFPPSLSLSTSLSPLQRIQGPVFHSFANGNEIFFSSNAGVVVAFSFLSVCSFINDYVNFQCCSTTDRQIEWTSGET